MIEKNKLGMICFLGSEIAFFAVLILAFLYYRSATVDVAAQVLDPWTTFIFTVFLLASSVTLWLAERSLAREQQGGVRLWLLVTVALGAIFLVGQALEYRHLFSENVTINRDLFGTTFFTLTGFHGLHVFSGLVALSILLGLASIGWVRGPHSPAIETIGWYWHFVDVVWVIIFFMIYIWPLL